VVIDVSERVLRLDLPGEEIDRRLRDWRPPTPRYASGVFAKYAALVTSAAEGAITLPPMTSTAKEQ
jgi:dihydroxy-acid dehydratase